MSLRDIDLCDIDTIVGFIGYLTRLRQAPPDAEPGLTEIRIGRKVYRRADIDRVTWL